MKEDLTHRQSNTNLCSAIPNRRAMNQWLSAEIHRLAAKIIGRSKRLVIMLPAKERRSER